jgi:hypothetical protein
MQTLHFDPRQRPLLGLVARVAPLILVLVAAVLLGQFGGARDQGARGAASAPARPATASDALSPTTPRWMTDPVASPLESLVRPAGE